MARVHRNTDLKMYTCGGKVKTIGQKACNTGMVNRAAKSQAWAQGAVFDGGIWNWARTSSF